MRGRQGHDLISKHRIAKTSKAKPKPKQSIKKSFPSKPKLRQTRLNLLHLQIAQTEPPDFPAPREGGGIEQLDSPDPSILGGVVTSPSNFRRDMYYNASPVLRDMGISFPFLI